ncbi:hypothetical protein [Hymenobacter cheonanensis]|uniref:hypothetical protein n=1 Tax=Hymenobacter sp. CA2-7 TaxID=3063993 RepID=UPI00271392CD|nr:hypothetical protein [Hymenobacter sp. CA2-7]MDO7887964.1 hypothetical protein [Hymenobacter sp. CA2-7]
MSTEAYSKRMAVHVRRELRQADGARFAELLAYYQQRRGPGLALAEAEATARAQRHQTNYPPQAA